MWFTSPGKTNGPSRTLDHDSTAISEAEHRDSNYSKFDGLEIAKGRLK